MLLDPATLDLAPVRPRGRRRLAATRLQARAAGGQLEIVLPPGARASPEAIAELGKGRASRRGAPAGSPVHGRRRTASVHGREGVLNPGPRYDASERRVRVGSAAPAHLRLPGPRRGRRRGPDPRRLQRAAGASCRSWPRWPRTGRCTAGETPDWRRPGRGSRATSAPGDAAARWRAGRRSPRSSRWGAEWGDVPEPGFWWWELRPHPRSGRSSCVSPTPRRRSPSGRDRGRRTRAGRLARRAGRRRRGLPVGAEVANRGEPLVGPPPGHGGDDGRPRRGERCRRASTSRLVDALAPVAARIGCGRGAGGRPRLAEATARRGSARARPSVAARGSPAGWRGGSPESATPRG